MVLVPRFVTVLRHPRIEKNARGKHFTPKTLLVFGGCSGVLFGGLGGVVGKVQGLFLASEASEMPLRSSGKAVEALPRPFSKRGKRGERFVHEAFAAFCRFSVGAQVCSSGASGALLGRCKFFFGFGGRGDAFGTAADADAKTEKALAGGPWTVMTIFKDFVPQLASVILCPEMAPVILRNVSPFV